MWFVSRFNTNGDARFVKGYSINGIPYAFLADGNNGLEIINISDPSNPAQTFNYNTSGNVCEVFIDSINGRKYAYLSDLNEGLFIINVSNPSAPLFNSNISYAGGVNSVNIKNGYLYTALVPGGVKVFNINNLPDTVIEVFTYMPAHPVEHIEVSGNTLFMTQGNSGLELANITNPSFPVYLSSFNSQGRCNDVKIGGNLAYIADGNAGICIANVGNPAYPYFVAQGNGNTDVRGIDYSPNFLFTAEYLDGAEVFNLFNPSNPDPFGYFEPQGNCYSVHYFRGKVLIANGQYGLLILRF